MHRKTSTVTARLAALRAFVVAMASRTGITLVQAVAAALTLIRGPRASGIHTLRASDIHPALAGLVRRRVVMTGIVAAPVLTLALVASTAALAGTAAPAPMNVAVADAQARQAATDRANRSSRDAAPAAPAPVLAAPTPLWVSPMPSVALSSCYGPRWGVMHQGMDFAGPDGTPILAVGGGTVFGAGWLYAGYGQSIVIDHGDGYFTHYAHTSRINVEPGQPVTAGQIIAWEGSTGNSTGPHLHFEVHQGLWNQVNPAVFLREHGVPIGC